MIDDDPVRREGEQQPLECSPIPVIKVDTGCERGVAAAAAAAAAAAGTDDPERRV
jgi:hypothetical protein